MLAGGTPRLVVRRSLHHVWAQLVETKGGLDRVIASAHSKELAKKGYKGCLNNTPASYLVGVLLGKKALMAKVKRAIVDVGMSAKTKGARVFAVAKGALDAGMDVPLGAEIVPDEKRLKGQHIAEYAVKLKGDTVKYQREFGQYLKKGLRPEELPKHVEEMKKAML